MLASDGRPLTIRWYQDDDLDAIAALHAACLPHERWSRADVVRFAARTAARTNVVKVLVAGDEVVGTLLYSLIKAQDECQIRRVCVAPAWRRRGYGSHLVRRLTGPNSTIRKQRFTAKVEERCPAGMRLFYDGDLGFTADDDSFTEPNKADRALTNSGRVFRLFKPAPRRRILVGA